MSFVKFLQESTVSTTRKHGTRDFGISSDTPLSFEQIKKHPTLVRYAGPHTAIFDVTDDVKHAPGSNKRNAMIKIFGGDDDEIVCANVNDGKWWLCVAINVDI